MKTQYKFQITPTPLSLTSDHSTVTGILEKTIYRDMSEPFTSLYSLKIDIVFKHSSTIKVRVKDQSGKEWTRDIPFNENEILEPQIIKYGDLLTSSLEVLGEKIHTFESYSQMASTTRIYKDQYKVLYPALKLSGEAGEVAEKIGKHLRDSDGDFTNEGFRQSMKKELGDVLWYIDAIAKDLGFTLQEVAECNIEKLQSRKQNNTLQGSGDNR